MSLQKGGWNSRESQSQLPSYLVQTENRSPWLLTLSTISQSVTLLLADVMGGLSQEHMECMLKRPVPRMWSRNAKNHRLGLAYSVRIQGLQSWVHKDFFPYSETLKLPLDQEHSAFWYQDMTLSSTNLLGCIYGRFSHVQPLGCSLNLPDLDG